MTRPTLGGAVMVGCTLLVVSVIVVRGGGADAAGQANRSFTPPRVAVVDISAVFENYQKTIDLRSKLRLELDKLDARSKELEATYRDLVDELKLIEDPAARRKTEVRRYQLELDLKWHKEEEFKAIRQKQFNFLRQLKDEISAEIQKYAAARDLDLVLEMTVTAEPGPRSPGFDWPIVHFAKPEINITSEITEILNRHYRGISSPR